MCAKHMDTSADQCRFIWNKLKQKVASTEIKTGFRSPQSKSNLESLSKVNHMKTKVTFLLQWLAPTVKRRCLFQPSKLISTDCYQLAPPDCVIPILPGGVVF